MIPINFGDPPEVEVCASECSVSTTGGWISVKIDTGIHGPLGMNCNDCGYSLTSFGSHHQKVKNSNVLWLMTFPSASPVGKTNLSNELLKRSS